MIKKIIFLSVLLLVGISSFTYRDKIAEKLKTTPLEVGDRVDSLNGVVVYYNGSVGHVLNRNTSADGYNIGLRYQCVEFVKRYYYEHLNHKMPNSYGHAKDFFVPGLADGEMSTERNLIQYTNFSASKPAESDLVIYDVTNINIYGHVAIISKVTENEVEIIQQNPGESGSSRETYKLTQTDGQWKIENDEIMGWLRKN